MKTMAMAGTGIINSQIPSQATKAYYGGVGGAGAAIMNNGVSVVGTYGGPVA